MGKTPLRGRGGKRSFEGQRCKATCGARTGKDSPDSASLLGSTCYTLRQCIGQAESSRKHLYGGAKCPWEPLASGHSRRKGLGWLLHANST